MDAFSQFFQGVAGDLSGNVQAAEDAATQGFLTIAGELLAVIIILLLILWRLWG
jgi:hypothetical protein